MDGVLVVDKPEGPTSHDVVAIARRALRERRIGHTGTLDPMATGVLPLVIGKATRLAVLLSSREKEYDAAVRLGAATATYDAADRRVAGGPPPEPPDVSAADIERVLARFRGEVQQVPPPFSAKKVAGVPAYKLARENRPPDLAPVAVTVHALEMLGYENGLLRLRVRASAGFYVRSLAHDVGAALGCGAHLEGLRRTGAGAFRLQDAVPLEVLVAEPTSVQIVPMAQLLPELPVAILTEGGARKASHGNPLTPEDLASRPFGDTVAASHWRLVSASGALLGVARSGPDGLLRPSIVLV